MLRISIPWPSPERLAALMTRSPHRLWLDSALEGHPHGNQSLIVTRPLLLGSFQEPGKGRLQDLNGRDLGPFDWEMVNSWLHRGPHPRSTSEFCGGVFGYLHFECFGPCVAIQPKKSEGTSPLARFYLVDSGIVLEHQKEQAWIFSWGLNSQTFETEPGLAEVRSEEILSELELAQSQPRAPQGKLNVLPMESREAYLKKVGTIQEALKAGDCYQVNLAQKFQVRGITDPASFYLDWRRVSPAPQMALWHLPEGWILSASPEILLLEQNGWLHSFPIKGTRPRGSTPQIDQVEQEKLMASPKDRAELLMIVDLVRNDLGRVCDFGTIQVPQLNVLDTLPHVHHLYAEVLGKLRPEYSAVHALQALIPGGSISGAPKQMALEWIGRLETEIRQIYTGNMGYFGWNGRSCWNIAIRTGWYQNGSLDYFAGGGIVVDSDPQAEYEETLVKARGLFEALTQSKGSYVESCLF